MVLMGFSPTLTPMTVQTSGIPAADDQTAQMIQAQKTAIEILNQPTPIPRASFAVGDCMWLEGKNLLISTGSSKLCPKRYGPFKISRIISSVAYQLELPSQWKVHPIFHASLLLPYKEMEQHGPNFIRPPPDIIEGQEQYEVEAICDHCYQGRTHQLQFLLKWKGYPEADNTWEPQNHIHMKELVKEYWARKKIKGASKL